MSKARASERPAMAADIGPDLSRMFLPVSTPENRFGATSKMAGAFTSIARSRSFASMRDGETHSAARDVASANASYLISPDLDAAVLIIEAIGAAMTKRFGAFVVLDVGELERDRLLSEDAPYLPPFEITVSATDQPAAQAAVSGFASAVESVEVKFRSPRLDKVRSADDPMRATGRASPAFPASPSVLRRSTECPESEDIYPELARTVIANIFDAGLQAVAAFAEATGILSLPTHRALGRQAFVDAVSRADRSIDEIAQTFDFLLGGDADQRRSGMAGFRGRRIPARAKTPLPAADRSGGRRKAEAVLDRVRHFEDPVLSQPLSRKTAGTRSATVDADRPRNNPFRRIGRALYGRVEPALLDAARDILARTEKCRAAAEDAGRKCRLLLAGARGAFDDRELSQATCRLQGCGRTARRSAGGSDGFGSPPFDLPQHENVASQGRGIAQPRNRRPSADLLQRLGSGTAPLPIGPCRI